MPMGRLAPGQARLPAAGAWSQEALALDPLCADYQLVINLSEYF